jgi:predicted transcriptional regulator
MMDRGNMSNNIDLQREAVFRSWAELMQKARIQRDQQQIIKTGGGLSCPYCQTPHDSGAGIYGEMEV